MHFRALGAAIVSATTLCAAEVPLARIGVMSDIHLTGPESAAAFRRVLEYCRDAGVDAVVIAGDIADNGHFPELALCAGVWDEVFPGDALPDGRHVEKLFIYGNHDIDGGIWHGRRLGKSEDWIEANAIRVGDNRAVFWEKLFREPYRPIWMKTVRGLTFIGEHWSTNPDVGYYDQSGNAPLLPAFLAEHAKELSANPGRPFFVILHGHPKDTVYGPWAWGHGRGDETAALSAFPNAVVLSGHSHYPLTDERSVWQGAFTSVGTASMRSMSADYAEAENSSGNDFDPREAERTRPRIMRRVVAQGERHAMLMDVFDGRVVLRRLSFGPHGPRALGADWEVPVPAREGSSLAFAARARDMAPPEFPAGAAVTATLCDKPPEGTARNGFSNACVHVTFPGAVNVDGRRVFEYRLRVLDGDGAERATRIVVAPDYAAPAGEPAVPGVCLFALDELPTGQPLRIEVSPLNCFGAAGKPIVGEFRADIAANDPTPVDDASPVIRQHE